MGWLLPSSVSFAKDYKLKQIADETMVNRDPSISSAGIVAWHGFKREEVEGFGKDVFAYLDGQAQNITKDFAEKNSAYLSFDD